MNLTHIPFIIIMNNFIFLLLIEAKILKYKFYSIFF